ncbi:ABC transporter permease subunit [Pseudazoarcus pumilus]|uniref:Polar amino acid ABC transporter permease n=1 Tax=Pseudazoarcus pumilus TaxID=2067960 RepID=A0A2I6S5S2_9RHOO|nr:ABC transporter permease subunit [Pseudazoarcus pumilus]AUN94609.1 polar amino acid ABC transporter permease [Pseudazoarcus pumilus]
MIGDSLEVLWTWTPFLLEGLYWNVVITLLATMLGTCVGGVLAVLHLSPSRFIARGVGFVVSVFRNVPSLVLLFYAATLIPNQIDLGGTIVNIPDWLKASIALAASPTGFTALNLHTSILYWRQGQRRAAMLFIPNWLGGLMITLLASSTASLVGVSELVGQCNTVIAATGTTYLVPIYVYALCLFFALCYPLSLALGGLKRHMAAKYA